MTINPSRVVVECARVGARDRTHVYIESPCESRDERVASSATYQSFRRVPGRRQDAIDAMILFNARAVRRRRVFERADGDAIESFDVFVRATRELELRRRHDDDE